MLVPSIRCLLIAGTCSLFAAPVSAEALTLDAALQRVLRSNPALRAEQATSAALAEQLALDRLSPPITIGAELENVAGTGAVSSLGGAEATLRLSKVLELGGKRTLRERRAGADLARQDNQISRQRLDLAAATTKRFIALVFAQAELDLAASQVKLSKETETVIAERVNRGVAPAGDLALAAITVARADLAQEHAGHEYASASFALAALWGESEPVSITAKGELLDLPALPEYQSLASKLPDTPELRAFDLDAVKLDSERDLARSLARPDVSISVGVRRLEALDDQALVLSFSMPIGLSPRATATAARLDAELDALAARDESAQLEARQLLFAKFQELRHARTEFVALGERMIPAAERGLALTRAGYDEARYSALQLSQAQSTLLQLHQERLNAAARYHLLLADIERATSAAGVSP